MTQHSGKVIEVEVLPPEKSAEAETQRISEFIARVMDNLVKVPGTNFKVGLDPILGLLPGFGDTGTALVSMVVLLQAAGAGLPRIAIARMALNVMINTVAGAIPGVGDAFSIWFKSNARNHAILKKYGGGKRRATRGDWVFVGVVLTLLALTLVGAVALAVFILASLASALGAVAS